MTIRLVLPVPPPVNHRLAVVQGRLIKSRPDRSFAKEVKVIARAEKVRPLQGPVAVRFVWYRERRAGDLDGRIKPLLDALTAVAYDDDKQVIELWGRIDDTQKARPRIEVQIRPVEGLSIRGMKTLKEAEKERAEAERSEDAWRS